jgi:thiol:disulfide interchange protein DsbD
MRNKAFLLTTLLLLTGFSLLAQTPINAAAEPSLWVIFLGGLAAGFAAFVMPCIYAMVPVTVGFFTKRSATRRKGIINATAYAASIILIFTLIGVAIAVTKQGSWVNDFSSSAAFNIFVFALFLVFGISFLGAFEITLPSSVANKVDARSNSSSFTGIFFMALTLVIVSFSCTVAFIGGLIPLLIKGSFIKPIVGFFAFGLAIALPFALLAYFPALLNRIAKSGGWLNSLKVCFGFLELALSLKFLSNADLAYHWRLLDREVYLALWIVIFALMGLYLLGKLKFSHDDELPKNDYGLPYLTVTRLFFAITVFSFVVYLIPGLWGAPLKGISAWIPETKTQDFNLHKSSLLERHNASDTATTSGNTVKPKKYTSFLESEILGVEAFFEYEEALAAAKAMNKPMMIDFTGHTCANCRKMESEVLNQDEIRNTLKKDFVVASLYVDDKYALPESEHYTSAIDGSFIKRMGSRNLDLEMTLANSNAQPLYLFVDKDGKLIKNADGYNPDISRFKNILEEVKAEHKKRFP